MNRIIYRAECGIVPFRADTIGAGATMHTPRFPDRFDWHGCPAVQFNPEKLGGRATVQDTRMDADGVLLNYQDGLTIDDIVESFGVDRGAVEEIIAFAEAKGLRATS